MKYQPDSPKSCFFYLAIVLLFLCGETAVFPAATVPMPQTATKYSLSIGVTQDSKGRRTHADLRTLRKTDSYMFESRFLFRHGTSDTRILGLLEVPDKLEFVFSGQLRFQNQKRIHVGLLQPRNLALELFRPLSVHTPFLLDSGSGGLFGFSADHKSFLNFAGFAVESTYDWGLLGRTSVGVSLSFPFWNGAKPWISMLLLESELPASRIALGIMSLHTAPTLYLEGPDSVGSTPSLDWSTLFPSHAWIMLGKVTVRPISVGRFLISSGVTFRMGWDLLLGHGNSYVWWIEAYRKSLGINIQWQKDCNIFQTFRPVGSQQPLIQSLRVAFRHELTWLLTEFQYDDELYKPPVHGGLRQRRKATTALSFTVRHAGNSYGVFVGDVTTWLPHGGRRGLHTIGFRMKMNIDGVDAKLTGEASWLRGGGSQPELFRGSKISVEIGRARVRWERGTWSGVLETHLCFADGRLTFLIDTERRITLTFTQSR